MHHWLWRLALLLPLTACDTSALNEAIGNLLMFLTVLAVIGLGCFLLHLLCVALGLTYLILNATSPTPRTRFRGIVSGCINALSGGSSMLGYGGYVYTMFDQGIAFSDEELLLCGSGLVWSLITLSIGIGGIVVGSRLRFDEEGRQIL